MTVKEKTKRDFTNRFTVERERERDLIDVRRWRASVGLYMFCPIRVRGRATDRPAEPRMGQILA
jgi:hypothetical protein